MHTNNQREKKSLIPANSEVSRRKPEPFSDASVKVGHMKIPDTPAPQDKSLKSQKKSAKSVLCTSINKKEFIAKFVKKDASLVWPREMKMVNSLFKIFPNDDFWNYLELKFKLNSLCWFLSDEGRKFLNIEYKKFNFEPEKPKTFDLTNNNIAFEGKIGETVQAPMTVREFLKLWQKKN
jgi:hypothetical protein